MSQYSRSCGLNGLVTRVGATLLAAVALAVACSSDEGGGGANDDDDRGGTGGTDIPLDLDSGSTATHDGGSVELTAEEVEAIENAACTGWSGEGELLPAVLQFVVDVSGSMEDWAPGSRDSKWSITHDAILEAIETLGSDTAVGMLLYPNVEWSIGTAFYPRPVDACVNTDELVPIDELGGPGAPHRNDVLQVLDWASTGDGTPTYDAYEYALEESLIPFETELKKFMLLITDGQPTFSEDCVGTGYPTDPADSRPIIDMIADAHGKHGIRTFIIGSPGSEEAVETGEDTRGWLSEAADKGGTGTPDCDWDGPNYCHLDMTESPDFSQALRDGLAQVIGQIGQCTYALPQPPPDQTLDLEAVNLIVHTTSGAKLVLPDNQDECGEGWTFDDDRNVVLCPDTCDDVKSDTTARVELLFGCISGEIPEIQ